VLTPLQRQVAEIVAGLEEAEGFALPGGAALIARGEVQRQTRDLDFFGLTAAAVDRLVPAVDRALRAAGLVVHHVQENPGFARLIVESADDRTELDVAADARLFPAEPRYAQLTRDVGRWREQALELARQRELERDRGRDLGREL
jgi:hypothetical protein